MMSSRPTTLLVLGLCLGWTVHMQEGSLPKPSISTEPWERGVIVVCQSTVDVDRFRLESGGKLVMDERSNPSTKKEARFYFDIITDSTSGCYQCLSGLENDWSPRSEPLKLKVTSENITQVPAPGSAVPSDTPGLKTDHIYALIGVSVFIILCLLFSLSLCMYRRHQGKQELLSGKGQQQRPQESPSPAANGMERTPDITEAERLPEKDRGTDVSAPVVGDLREVTYAQLDHGALTQSTASEGTAGRYKCLFERENSWSIHSETLVLEVTSENTTQVPSPSSIVSSDSVTQSCTVGNGVRIGLAAVILVVLVVVLGEAWQSQHSDPDSLESSTP